MNKQRESGLPSTINEETDVFLSYLEKRQRNLRKKLNEIGELKKKQEVLNQEQTEKINQENTIQIEIEQFQKMKEQYILSHQKAQNQSTELICSNSSDNLLSIYLRNQRKDILLFISDLIYFSRLAYQSRIESEILANFYRENILVEKKLLEEMTYGQEKQMIEETFRKIYDQDSLLRQELARVDKSILKERIQPQILELDEDIEDDGLDDSSNIIRDDQDEEEKEEVGSIDEALKQHPIFYQFHSQNYDGDSEKSHTENEIHIKVKTHNNNNQQEGADVSTNNNNNTNSHNNTNNIGDSNQSNSNNASSQMQHAKHQQSNRNYYNNYNSKYFRRYKQNRYREERFAYVRRNKNNVNSNEISNKDSKVLNNNEYESDIPFSNNNEKIHVGEDVKQIHHQHTLKSDNVSYEDMNIKSNLSDNNNPVQNNTNSSQNANSSNNNLNYRTNTNIKYNENSSAAKPSYKKHFNSNQRRQNPYRKNNDYDTDREKV